MDRRTHADGGRVVPVRACRTFRFLMHFALRAILWRPHGLRLCMHPDGLSVDVRLGVLSLGVQRGRTPEELKLRWACQCQAQWIELRCEAQWLKRRRVS